MDMFWLYKFEFCTDLTPYTQEHKSNHTGIHLIHTQSAEGSQLAHREIKKKKAKVLNTPNTGSILPVSNYFQLHWFPACLVCSVTLRGCLSWVLLHSWLEPMWTSDSQNVPCPEVLLLISWRTWGFGPGPHCPHLWTLVLLLETGKNQSQSTYSQFSKLKSK